ncbi:hypothetical protein BDZ89DRAFT_1072596 [Hymenopellis radicata]|nr:hypothetical protein BDZ89DRAFT_1072596 [Hymenopellis radicata]
MTWAASSLLLLVWDLDLTVFWSRRLLCRLLAHTTQLIHALPDARPGYSPRIFSTDKISYSVRDRRYLTGYIRPRRDTPYGFEINSLRNLSFSPCLLHYATHHFDSTSTGAACYR